MNEPNGKIEFTYQYAEGEPKVTMILHPDSDLNQVIEAFEKFLFAAGYSFTGNLYIDGNNIVNQNAEEN